MRPGPAIHGALLAVALGVAWQTWTRDRAAAPSVAALTVWADGGPVEGVALHGALREVTVERRGSGDGAYFWGAVKKSTPPPPRPEGPDAGVSLVEDKGTTSTVEFPVGADGEKALARLAPLTAVRDLGASASNEEYGLGDAAEKLTVKTGGAAHELVLGAKVFGGDDRYVLDPAGGHVYVVAGEVLRAFDAPEFALRERRLHDFPPADVAEVTVRAGGHERTLVRKAHGAPEGDRPGRPPAASWADAKTPDQPDQSLANFMERVEQLAPVEFGKPAEAATPVGTLEYRGRGGKVLGSVELLKKAGTPAEYFVVTERTRGPAKVSPAAAVRVEEDLGQLLK